MSSTPPISLRLATRDDADTIHGLLRALAAATGKAEDILSRPQDIQHYGFDRDPGFECLLAFSGEEAVGLAVYFYEFSTWRGTPGVYVQDLYVAERLRGGGLGRQLMDAVRARAARWDSRYVKLAVYGDNPGAIAFYRRLGFRPSRDEQVLIWRY